MTEQTDGRDLEKLLDEVEALCGVYVGKAKSEEWGETCRQLERLDKLVKKLRRNQAGRQ